ncbi:hypothetical protein [Hoylesella enoeca]|uniref:hypothetical protein n=1 Tax=Hoylesella enoeca TaxID=76123 RepID=UPI000A95270B|nr:hypothetical protein [Hoylesella enoeca]
MKIKEFKRSDLQSMEHFQFAGHMLAMCKMAKVKKLNPLLTPLEAAIAVFFVLWLC